MSRVATTIESSIKYWKRFKRKDCNLKENLDYKFNMNYSVCTLAASVNAKAIISYTNTGDTARMLSSFGPECPIFAITENETTYRQLGAAWNIIPKLFPHQETIDKLVYLGVDTLKREGFLKPGDKVVIAGGAKAVTDLGDNEATRNSSLGGIVEI